MRVLGTHRHGRLAATMITTLHSRRYVRERRSLSPHLAHARRATVQMSMTTPILEATTEGTIDFREWKTWYRVTGDLNSGLAPLVAAHGGPGGTHDYLLTMADI